MTLEQITIAGNKRLCACGCGELSSAVDRRGRPRRFIWGHDNKFKLGHENPAWIGGRHNDSKGYPMIKCVGHPKADAQGYVYEHVLVMENYYQCCMLKWGVVHHINEIRTDNRPENLQGMMRYQHSSLHHKAKVVAH